MSSQPVVLSRVYARGQVVLGDLAVILHLLDVWGKGPPQHRGVVNPCHLPYLDKLGMNTASLSYRLLWEGVSHVILASHNSDVQETSCTPLASIGPTRFCGSFFFPSKHLCSINHAAILHS